MTRCFLASFALIACLSCCLPGCGSGGGEAQFPGGTIDVEAEQKAMEDYAAEQAKQAEQMRKGSGN